jgi:multidrug efflux pump subunit AcrA (membrane-fusion protein)
MSALGVSLLADYNFVGLWSWVTSDRMNARRILIPLVNLIVFVAAGLVLFRLGNGLSSPTTSADVGNETTGPRNVLVHVAAVTRQTLQRTLTAFGQVEPAAAGSGLSPGRMIASVPFAGNISEMDCVEGQRVKAGDVLFKTTLNGVLADMKLGLLMNPFSVNSSISGVVQSIDVGAGEVVIPGQPVVEVIDPDRLVLALQIPGFLVGEVKAGQRVRIEVPSESGAGASGVAPATRPSPIESTVQFVDPAIDPATGLASVDVALPAGSPFRLGQFLRAGIVVEELADCLAVPAEAIVRDASGRAEIGVVSADEHQAVLHPIETGIRDGDLVSVRSDWVEPGTAVVTAGSSALITRTGIQVVGR